MYRMERWGRLSSAILISCDNYDIIVSPVSIFLGYVQCYNFMSVHTRFFFFFKFCFNQLFATHIHHIQNIDGPTIVNFF